MRPKLSSCDWVEIYYALDSKIRAICACGIPQPDTMEDRWVNHLTAIMKQIGEDGNAAAKAFGAGRSHISQKSTHGGLIMTCKQLKSEVPR